MFGRFFGRKKEEEDKKTPPCTSSGIVHNVNLPGESTMYYDHENKRWRERGKEHLEEGPVDYGAPPEVGEAIRKEILPEKAKKDEKLDFMMAPPTAYTQRLLEKKKTAPASFFGTESERKDDGAEAAPEAVANGEGPPPASTDEAPREGAEGEEAQKETQPPSDPVENGDSSGPPAGPPPMGPPMGGPPAASSPFGAAAAAAAPSTNPFGGAAPAAKVINPFAPRAVTGAPNPNAPKGFRESARKQKDKEKDKKKAQEKKKPSPYSASAYGKGPGQACDDMMDPEGAGDAGEICFVSAVAKERQETPPPPPPMAEASTAATPALGETGEEEHHAPPVVPPSPLRTSMPAYSPFVQPQIPRGYGGREDREAETADAAQDPEDAAATSDPFGGNKVPEIAAATSDPFGGNKDPKDAAPTSDPFGGNKDPEDAAATSDPFGDNKEPATASAAAISTDPFGSANKAADVPFGWVEEPDSWFNNFEEPEKASLPPATEPFASSKDPEDAAVTSDPFGYTKEPAQASVPGVTTDPFGSAKDPEDAAVTSDPFGYNKEPAQASVPGVATDPFGSAKDREEAIPVAAKGAASPSDGWGDDFGFSDEEEEKPKPQAEVPSMTLAVRDVKVETKTGGLADPGSASSPAAKQINHLMAYMMTNQSDILACSKVCASLENMTFDDADALETLISGGGVQVILSLLQMHQECDPMLLKPMVDTFWNLTFDEQAVEHATAHGAVQCVKCIMEKHLNNAEFQVGCVSVLLNLAVMDQNRRQLVEMGAATVVTRVVQTHATREEVVEAGCQLLYMLAFHADLRPMLAACAAPVAQVASRCRGQACKKWGQWLAEAV